MQEQLESQSVAINFFWAVRASRPPIGTPQFTSGLFGFAPPPSVGRDLEHIISLSFP